MTVNNHEQEKVAEEKQLTASDVEESSAEENTANENADAEPIKQESQNDSPPVTPKKNRRWILILVVLVLLLSGISGALVYFGYIGWGEYQKDKAFYEQEINSLQQSMIDLQQNNANIRAGQEQEKGQAAQNISKLQARLTAAEQRIVAQNKRLQSMSTTTREDWLLAEAEYLLKLANQRVLVERSAESADALLVEADAILRDLVDPDLFPLRQAIANDLAAIRLAKSIDVEGIYLSLQALAGQVESIPVKPEPDFGDDKSSLNQTEQKEAETPEYWWQKPLNSIRNFMSVFGNQINITHHEDGYRPIVLMSPKIAQYAQQNLRMQIERAQLALLREQQKIYSESLTQASTWIGDYFPASERAKVFQGELQRLAAINVVKTLPDISGSLELLNAYIAQLHDLEGVPARTEQGGAQ